MTNRHDDRTDGLSRQKFLQNLGITSVVGGTGGLATRALAWGEGSSGPIDCGCTIAITTSAAWSTRRGCGRISGRLAPLS